MSNFSYEKALAVDSRYVDLEIFPCCTCIVKGTIFFKNLMPQIFRHRVKTLNFSALHNYNSAGVKRHKKSLSKCIGGKLRTLEN